MKGLVVCPSAVHVRTLCAHELITIYSICTGTDVNIIAGEFYCR
jgi:hypothetical protein